MMIKALLVVLVFVTFALTSCGAPYAFHGKPYEPVAAAPEIAGIRAGNSSFKLSGLKEKVKLLFFGYTFCPDVCPLTLANMRAAYDKLSENDRKQVAVVMISVDPERDMPDRLGAYVAAVDPPFTAYRCSWPTWKG